MKKKSIIKFAWVLLVSEWKRMVLLIVINIICFLLLIAGLCLYEQKNYNRNSCNRMLPDGVEATGFVLATPMEEQSEIQSEEDSVEQLEAQMKCMDAWMDEISDYEGIKTLGYAPNENEGILGCPELLEKQMEVYPDAAYHAVQSVEIIPLHVTQWELGELALEEGTLPDALDLSRPEVTYIYLGADYKDIPVGTEYVEEYPDGTKTIVEVAGILKENSQYLSPEISAYTDLELATFTVPLDLDNRILCVGNECPESGLMYTIDTDHYQMEDVIADIEAMADRHNIEIKIGTLDAKLTKAEVEVESIMGDMLEAFVWIFVVVVLLIMCMQMMDFIVHQYDFGLMRVTGFSGLDIFGVFLLQNIIKIVFSYAIGAALAKIYLPQFITSEMQDGNRIFDEIIQRVIWGRGLWIMLLMLFLSIVIPFIWVRKTTIVKLLRRS